MPSPVFSLLQEHAALAHLQMRECFAAMYPREALSPGRRERALDFQREAYMTSALERHLRGVE